MAVTHPALPRVAQTHPDTCWAAALESWSRSSLRPFPVVTQAALAQEYGEGATRGITPAKKIPKIAARFLLSQSELTATFFRERIEEKLSRGIVFCAYPVGRYCHAVLVYGCTDDGGIHIMNPDGGRFELVSAAQMALRGRFIVMWQEMSLNALGL